MRKGKKNAREGLGGVVSSRFDRENEVEVVRTRGLANDTRPTKMMVRYHFLKADNSTKPRRIANVSPFLLLSLTPSLTHSHTRSLCLSLSPI